MIEIARASKATRPVFKGIGGSDLRDEALLAAVLEKPAHRQREIYAEIGSRDSFEIQKAEEWTEEWTSPGNKSHRARRYSLDRGGCELQLFDVDAGS